MVRSSVKEYLTHHKSALVSKKMQRHTITFSHLIDQDKILLARDEKGERTLYIDGQGIDEHFGHVNEREAKAYVTNHLGSVLNTEVASDRKMFGPFGERLSKDQDDDHGKESLDPVAYGFAGRSCDTETGLYYNRARSYNPNMGRFMTKDPIGYRSGDTNLYRFVGNNPLVATDPYGECTLSLGVMGSVGAVVFGGAGGALNFGYSNEKGFSFSLTRQTELGLSGTPEASVLGSLSVSDALDVSGLNGESNNYTFAPAVGILQGGGYFSQSTSSDVTSVGLVLGFTTPTFGVPISTSVQTTTPIGAGETYGPPIPSGLLSGD